MLPLGSICSKNFILDGNQSRFFIIFFSKKWVKSIEKVDFSFMIQYICHKMNKLIEENQGNSVKTLGIKTYFYSYVKIFFIHW